MKYVLATSVYCCSVLGLELVFGFCYCFLSTTFREVTISFSLCFVQRRLVDAHIIDVGLMLFMDPV